MTQKEKALEEFAEDGWLAAVPGRPGTYSLGVSAHRAFLTLMHRVAGTRSLLELHSAGQDNMLTRPKCLQCT